MKYLPVLALALAASASLADPPATTLDADTLRTLVSGNTLYSETRLARFAKEPVRIFHLHLRPDGTLTIRNFDGNTDTGRWEILADGLFCSQYHHTRRGMRKCYEVEPLGDGEYGMRDTEKGTLSSVFSVRPGNPENLLP